MFLIKACAVVLNLHNKIAMVGNFDADMLRTRVFPDVGQAFLQDEDDLQMLIIIQSLPVVLPI
ncbi:MAG: hypothetical protein HXM86_07370 [Neisseria sp.]|nr:hypothetical protein [Neisseria sp.]